MRRSSNRATIRICWSKVTPFIILLLAVANAASAFNPSECEAATQEYLFDNVLDLPQNSTYRDPSLLYDPSSPFMTENWTDPTGFIWPWQNKIAGFNHVQNRALMVTLKGCRQLCGYGYHLYGLSDMANIVANWVLPSLALIVQLPYESSCSIDNFWALLRWIGCPPAAFAATLWNVWIIATAERRANKHNTHPGLHGGESTRDAFYVLSVLNQYEFDVGSRVLHKTLFYALFEPEIHVELATLAHHLRVSRRRAVVPVLLSQFWFLVALVITTYQAFGDMGGNLTAHCLALNLTLAWLPGLSAVTIVDRNPTADQQDKAMIEKWLHNAQYHRQLRAVCLAEKSLKLLKSPAGNNSSSSAAKGMIWATESQHPGLMNDLRRAISEMKKEAEITWEALRLIKHYVEQPVHSRKSWDSHSSIGSIVRRLTGSIREENAVVMQPVNGRLQNALYDAIRNLESEHIQELRKLETALRETSAPLHASLTNQCEEAIQRTKTKYFPARIIYEIRRSSNDDRQSILNAIEEALKRKGQIQLNNIQHPGSLGPDGGKMKEKGPAYTTTAILDDPATTREIRYVLDLFAAQVESLASSGYWLGGTRRFQLGEFRGQGRHPWHYGCAASVFKRLELESSPQDQLKSRKKNSQAEGAMLPRSELGDEIFADILMRRNAFFEYYIAVWIISVFTFIFAISLAFMVTLMTPTVGLGCRSFVTMMYGFFVMGGVLMEVIGAPLNHRKKETLCKYILMVSRTFDGLAVISLSVIVVCEIFGFFQNCYCKSSVMWVGGGGGYVTLQGSQWVQSHYSVQIWWILASATGITFVTAQIIFSFYLWTRCKGIWRGEEDPLVNPTLDWENEGEKLASQQHRWDLNWLK